MTGSPDYDQKAARLQDLERLQGLIRPYLAGPGVDVLPLMPPDDRAEARAILDRLGIIGEPPEKTAARQETLLRLAKTEDILREILARPRYLVRDGKVVTDPQTGEPLPDRGFDRRARAALAALERFRRRLTGLPPAGT